MEIQTRDVRDVTVVDMIGRLDSRTSGPASTELNKIAQVANRKVLLNVDKLEYVSSAGLRAILVAAKLAQVNGGAIKNACEQLRERLHVRLCLHREPSSVMLAACPVPAGPETDSSRAPDRRSRRATPRSTTGPSPTRPRALDRGRLLQRRTPPPGSRRHGRPGARA